MRRARQGLFVAVLALAACRSFVGFSDYPDEDDGGTDAASAEAAAIDVGVADTAVDVGAAMDASSTDAETVFRRVFTSSDSIIVSDARCVRMHAKLWGAGGGTSLNNAAAGGAGGFVEAEWTKTNAGVDNVDIVVGTAGGAPDGGVPFGGSGGEYTPASGGTAAGGGGGMTSVTHGDVLLIAGAGGGGCAAGGVGGAGGGAVGQAGVDTLYDGGVGGAGGNAGGTTTNAGEDGRSSGNPEFGAPGGGGAGRLGGAAGQGIQGSCGGGGGGSSFFGLNSNGTQGDVTGTTEAGDRATPGRASDPDRGDAGAGAPGHGGRVVVWCTTI